MSRPIPLLVAFALLVPTSGALAQPAPAKSPQECAREYGACVAGKKKSSGLCRIERNACLQAARSRPAAPATTGAAPAEATATQAPTAPVESGVRAAPAATPSTEMRAPAAASPPPVAAPTPAATPAPEAAPPPTRLSPQECAREYGVCVSGRKKPSAVCRAERNTCLQAARSQPAAPATTGAAPAAATATQAPTAPVASGPGAAPAAAPPTEKDVPAVAPPPPVATPAPASTPAPVAAPPPTVTGGEKVTVNTVEIEFKRTADKGGKIEGLLAAPATLLIGDKKVEFAAGQPFSYFVPSAFVASGVLARDVDLKAGGTTLRVKGGTVASFSYESMGRKQRSSFNRVELVGPVEVKASGVALRFAPLVEVSASGVKAGELVEAATIAVAAAKMELDLPARTMVVVSGGELQRVEAPAATEVKGKGATLKIGKEPIVARLGPDTLQTRGATFRFDYRAKVPWVEELLLVAPGKVTLPDGSTSELKANGMLKFKADGTFTAYPGR